MKRRNFIQRSAILSTGIIATNLSWLKAEHNAAQFPVVRPLPGDRKFKSQAIESAIKQFKDKVNNQEIAWLFGNCFPNTLDTTVTHEIRNGKPDTYVITGDIDAMWLRDSTAQVWPYLDFMKSDVPLQKLIAGVIYRQTHYILKDPYANAFYLDEHKVGHWKDDITEMKAGIHERKWEIDSLCYPIRLAYQYWKKTSDIKPFDDSWKKSIVSTRNVFKEQQRKTDRGPYKFQRRTEFATDGVPLNGYGYPVKPVGLICSMFRPSDDATLFPFLIPSNFFAVVSLRQAAEMIREILHDPILSESLELLAREVEDALKQHAVVKHAKYGEIYAYEVNGMGSYNLMDDANVPSLLSLPYLGAVSEMDPVYLNTRKFLLSADNPFYFEGKAGKGIGGPHVGVDMIWPLSIIMQGLTTINAEEVRYCIQALTKTHGGTGFMHEAFHKDDASNFTRSWFAWANTIFGEFLWKTFRERPDLLS